MLVRLKITYCSQLWRPLLLKDIKAIESIQKRATKLILSDFTSDYKQRLTKLHLLPIMYYFELQDILFTVKSPKYPSPNFNIQEYISFASSSTRLTTNRKMIQQFSRTSTFRHYYFNQIVKLWNSIPTIDLNEPLPSIKETITTFLWQHFIVNFNPNNTCTYRYICPCPHCH